MCDSRSSLPNCHNMFGLPSGEACPSPPSGWRGQLTIVYLPCRISCRRCTTWKQRRSPVPDGLQGACIYEWTAYCALPMCGCILASVHWQTALMFCTVVLVMQIVPDCCCTWIGSGTLSLHRKGIYCFITEQLTFRAWCRLCYIYGQIRQMSWKEHMLYSFISPWLALMGPCAL